MNDLLSYTLGGGESFCKKDVKKIWEAGANIMGSTRALKKE